MYSEYVMESVRQALGLEKQDVSQDALIFEMDRETVLDYYLQWHGLIGFTDDILETIEDIYHCIFEERMFYGD